MVSLRNKSNIPADKVSYLIDIYNTEDVNSQLKVSQGPDYLGHKYTISGHSNQVLVQIISLPIDLEIIHRNEEYIIFVGFWCKDLDFDFVFWTYNPNSRQIVCEDRLEFEKTNLVDEINRVMKITLPNNG